MYMMINLNNIQIRAFLHWSYDKGVTIRDYYHYLAMSNKIPKAFYKGYNQRLMICPLHDDSAPSMGTLFDRDGTELFHCFGCGKAGTVIDLAREVLSLHDTKSEILNRVLISLNKDADSMIEDWSKSYKSSPKNLVDKQEVVSYNSVIDMLKQRGQNILTVTVLLERAFITNTYVIEDN